MYRTLSKAQSITSFILLLVLSVSAAAGELPVIVPEMPAVDRGIRNPITWDELHNIIAGDKNGLVLDLGDAYFHGRVSTGPYPFESEESDYDYPRYRTRSALTKGKANLNVSAFHHDKYNSDDWPKDMMTIAYRVDLYRTQPDGTWRDYGFYDGRVSFQKVGETYQKRITIVEGPFICQVRSEDTGSVVIAWETDEPCIGTVYLAGPSSSDQKEPIFKPVAKSEPTRRHEVTVSGLKSNQQYSYYVQCDNGEGDKPYSDKYTFRTAPQRGEGDVSFAFASDSREGIVGGERASMGVNLLVQRQIAIDAYRRGADFYLGGGDLINGYSTSTDDFALQLKAWKRAVSGFWRSRPVYTAMGNHEALLNQFSEKGKGSVSMDKWPYETDSAEAVFAREFVNPLNGPKPSDPRRPPYKENVYKFQYGPVLSISFNNNYWYTSDSQCKTYGGSPQGYMMDDQLAWIERVLKEAESDKTVKFIVLFAQEPVFPCGGHVGDAMWWGGNNNVKAYEKNREGKVVSAGPGILEVRDRFWKSIAQSSKVACVLVGDEHEYHRLLVDKTTPVGVVGKDDKDGDGVLDQQSPNPEFTHPTWQVTSGTAGAPFYAREKTPWEPAKLSSQSGYLYFETHGDKISMTFYSITGQAVDRVDDLMAIKRKSD